MKLECPTEVDLTAFSAGDLSEEHLETLARHLEGCAECERRLEELERVSDPNLAAVRAAAQAVSAHALAAGARVGDYEILSELGRGGMGVVFKARHLALNRVVALKLLLGGQFAPPEHRGRFRAEAEAAARLQHPNVVQLFETGEWLAPDGASLPFLALEYVEGGTLARCTDRPQPPARAAAWVETLARAVEAAHCQGVIHRDLKPSNVLLTADGLLKLCDFGVAKLQQAASRTASGLLVGTPEYMAPEQASGRAQTAGPATDVWALGAILYALLTGRPPFQAPDALGVLLMLQTDQPVPPRQLQPGLPRDLETVRLKCLEKEPAGRYSSALELAADLRRFLDGEPIVARPAGPAERAAKWARRHPGVSALLAALTVVTALGFALVSWKWREANRRAVAEADARAEADEIAGREKEARRQAETLLAGAVIDEALVACERGNIGLVGRQSSFDG